MPRKTTGSARASASTKPVVHVKDLSWPQLNAWLMQADEQDCLRLMKEERAGEFRIQVLNRIFCRYNKLRGQRERREFLTPPT